MTPRFLLSIGLLLLGAILAVAEADTPASSVRAAPVTPGQEYPGVDINSEGWFDVGGFCKVVDVGDLSALNPKAKGVPVFIPGPASQWENYRTLAAKHYNGQLVLTTCCRPQSNIATLCSAGTNPQPVSRQYGKLGEIDKVSATCLDAQGQSYTDSLLLTCQGDNGPDGQALWTITAETEVCTPNASASACSAQCGGGKQVVYDSCGNAQYTQNCNMQSCCVSNGSCSSQCTTQVGYDNCGNSCYGTNVCQCTATTVSWTDTCFMGWANNFATCSQMTCSGNVPTVYAGQGATATPSGLLGVVPNYENSGLPAAICYGGSSPWFCDSGNWVSADQDAGGNALGGCVGRIIFPLTGDPYAACGASPPPPTQPGGGGGGPSSPSCGMQSVANGTINTCTGVITCNSGYTLQGSSCLAAQMVAACLPKTYKCGATDQTFEDCSGTGVACGGGPCSGPGCSGGSTWTQVPQSQCGSPCDCIGAFGTSVAGQDIGPGCCSNQQCKTD